MIYLCLSYAAMVALMMVSVARAPLGYEDERGFHYGEPK